MLPKNTMFAVLISESVSDINKYEKEYGFIDKDRQIIMNRMDEATGIDYLRHYKTIEQIEKENR